MTDIRTSLDHVERLTAESAIQRLLSTYTHRLDGGDFDGVAELFQHAEMDVLGNVVSGRDGVRDFLEMGLQVHADATPRTWHTLANVLVDIAPSGDKATSASYYTVHQQTDGLRLQPICTGKYLDEFERQEGQWRFTRRVLTLHLVGDLSDHVKGSNEEVVSRSAKS
ncbi:polyketide cyclase [Pigmentiphaga litoralis]|uniref:nuclear transport factor 2 family protein n=1 Tax=Pigmentiphaga litoralis TaxID=516702 RepID=UPI0019CDE462|nr:nuclear transport factor 2 family protein [Pigmentiphaga litoralis]GGX19738.1 polyketide cyclase [Pigmentiphaga litoralis]